MSMRLGLMFAGQGAQYPGMGRDLYEQSPAARAVFYLADRTLSRPVTSLCFEATPEELTASANCQPAIYTMSLACAAALQEAADFELVVCGGLSLGEFAAVTVAGALTAADGLPLVARRGELMDTACRTSAGAMAAVLGADPELLARICASCEIDVANYNCPGQVVISGSTAGLESAVSAMAEAGITKVIRLQVAGAFHSRLMQPAADAFAPLLQQVPFNRPACPVAQNVSGCLADDPEQIRDNLRAQVTGSVRWEDCVTAMRERSVDMLVEVGPGQVLSGFMKRIDRRFPVAQAGTMDTIRNLAQTLRS